MLTMSLIELALLNKNGNSNVPGNVNPEFAPDEGCGCTFSYNGGAGGGTAIPCDGSKPYEEGFNDKKRDGSCCCESDRCYERPLVNKKPDGECKADFKYVPEFNYPAPPCAPGGCGTKSDKQASSCGSRVDTGTYQGGLTNKKPECSTEYKYVVPSVEPQGTCKKSDQSCCGTTTCNEPDSYEMIGNTDAQRYKGKGPDRSNFYADDDCGCAGTNNTSSNNNILEEDLDWSEVRRYAYASADCSPCNSPRLPRRMPSFYCEEENYVGALRKPRYMAGGSNAKPERSPRRAPVISSSSMGTQAAVSPGVSPAQQLAGGEDNIEQTIEEKQKAAGCIIS